MAVLEYNNVSLLFRVSAFNCDGLYSAFFGEFERLLELSVGLIA
jgi:hypothetical protein